MNYKSEFIQLESNLNELNSSLSSLEGKCSLLTEQIAMSELKLIKYAHKREVYRKSVELLTLVQKTTNDKTKEGLEQIITYALRFILNDTKYGLNVNFQRRGNLTELNFNLKTPDCQEPHDPLESLAGGCLDVLSFAIRIALQQLIKPKIGGFIVLDEPCKHLSTNYLANAEKFFQAINKKLNKQVIIVTHKAEFLNSENNLIKIEEGLK